MLGWLLASGIGFAAKGDDIEEIIVYGDDFARWDDTRWLVQSELWLPLGVTFQSDENLGFRTYAFQIRAVISCDKDAQLGKKKWEVSCEIEDIGILTTTERHFRRARDREAVQQILDEMDAKLTGMEVQMQVDEEGGVTNFDLEGFTANNARERAMQESLRQVVSRTMSGFHLRIPDHGQRSGQWLEYRSKLMDMPSLTASRGSTTMVHQVTPYGELQIVQTVGEGIVVVAIPSVSPDSLFSSSAIQDDGSSLAPGGVSGLGGPAAISAPPPEDEVTPVSEANRAELAVDASYDLKASGVALFRKADGIMSERVWLVEGFPTASSGGGVNTGPFRNAGRIQILGDADKPDVGPSRQVAWPGRKMEGLDPWVSIEAMPGGSKG